MTIERHFRHRRDAENPDLVWWTEASAEDTREAQARENYRDLIQVLPPAGSEGHTRERIRELAKARDISRNKADAWLKLLIEDKLVERVEILTDAKRKEARFRRVEEVREVAP